MKNIILFAVIIFSTACNKGGNNNTPTPTPPTNAALNTTEQKLLGTWYLKKEHYKSNIKDTSFTTFTGNAMVKFTDAAYTQEMSVENAKKCSDNAHLATAGVSGGGSGYLRGSATVETPWSYSEDSKYLVFLAANYNIVVLTQSQLTLSPVLPADISDTLWFEK